MCNIQNEINEVRVRMRCKGFRPVTKMDIVGGREMVMVEVERYFGSGADLPPIGLAGTTVIRIDDKATQESLRHDGGMVVFYHCINPQWSGGCFVGINDFVRDAYSPHAHSNDTRYFVKTQ